MESSLGIMTQMCYFWTLWSTLNVIIWTKMLCWSYPCHPIGVMSHSQPAEKVISQSDRFDVCRSTGVQLLTNQDHMTLPYRFQMCFTSVCCNGKCSGILSMMSVKEMWGRVRFCWWIVVWHPSTHPALVEARLVLLYACFAPPEAASDTDAP